MARIRERSYHSLDLPLPAVLLYFRPGDAVMACFDDECEYWGQETPEPNLIIPLRPDDPASVRQALAVIETLMRVLVLTVRIKTIIEEPGEIHMRFSIDVGSELELKLYQAVLLYKNDHGNRYHGDRPRRGAARNGDGTPLLGAGQLLSTAACGSWRGSWERVVPVEFLPGTGRRANSGPDWHGGRRRRCGQCSSATGSELAGISGKRFPHPALLFVVRSNVLYVRALLCKPEAGSRQQIGGSALLEHRQ